jgi:hypothetical protein
MLALNWSKFAMYMLSFKVDDPLGKSLTKPATIRWFAYADSSDKDLEKIRKRLLDGFKKVANISNSSRLIFSDEPLDRNNGGWKDWAFVYSTEKIDVIYLQKAFLDAAENGKKWECALTIIHEITHRELKTDDHAYGTDNNIKPHKSHFKTSRALNNADSWGYFATDLSGQLSASELIRTHSGSYA